MPRVVSWVCWEPKFEIRALWRLIRVSWVLFASLLRPPYNIAAVANLQWPTSDLRHLG
jgi:hypothetical protein